MNLEILTAASTAVILVLLGACIGIAAYSIYREKRLLSRIQQMLDDAIAGNFQDVHLDESKISAIESSMWRYLCDKQVSYKKLSGEKEQIQALISAISHQTVTPIGNIILYAQLLEERNRAKGNEESREDLEEIATIREQAEKLDFLVECLVKLSRLEAGIIKVNPEKQDVSSVLTSVQKQFVTKAAAKDIRLSVDDSSAEAVFDINWTIEAAANIVDNAIKYTPCGGGVSVSVKSYSFFVCIDIADNGAGIPESEQSVIFTRFYRSAAVSCQPGLGIGLYLAREVLKAQNGYIKIASKEGAGSTFSLFLPREEMSPK